MPQRPLSRPSDPALADLYDAAVGGPRQVLPETAPRLRCITMANIAEMRKNRGDTAGNLGPRACVVAGAETVLDGGQAMYIWDQTSTLPDNGTTVVQAGPAVGRWRRVGLLVLG